MSDQTPHRDVHYSMFDALNRDGTFDHVCIDDNDGACHILRDGQLFRVELHLIED